MWVSTQKNAFLDVDLKTQRMPLFFFHGNKSTYIIFIVWARWDLDVDPKGQESFYFSEIS